MDDAPLTLLLAEVLQSRCVDRRGCNTGGCNTGAHEVHLPQKIWVYKNPSKGITLLCSLDAYWGQEAIQYEQARAAVDSCRMLYPGGS